MKNVIFGLSALVLVLFLTSASTAVEKSKTPQVDKAVSTTANKVPVVPVYINFGFQPKTSAGPGLTWLLATQENGMPPTYTYYASYEQASYNAYIWCVYHNYPTAAWAIYFSVNAIPYIYPTGWILYDNGSCYEAQDR